jgi:hypothetical protein
MVVDQIRGETDAATHIKEPKMVRQLTTAVLVLAIVPNWASAQMGGMGGGMAVPVGQPRTVAVDLEGGTTIEGTLPLSLVQVESSIGRYELNPGMIRSIRFLKPAAESHESYNPYVLWPGTVIVASGSEIKGDIRVEGWKLATNVGVLTPKASMIREIRFLDNAKSAAGAKTGESKNGTETAMPRTFRIRGMVLSCATADGKVSMLEIETKKKATCRLQELGEEPLEIVPIDGGDIVALMLNGPKIRNIAVYDCAAGKWYPQVLKEVVAGQASPIVNERLVAYALGQRVYAYSSTARRWDMVELPENVPATPILYPNSASIESADQIYTFKAKTGTWEHADLKALLSDDESKANSKPAIDRKP